MLAASTTLADFRPTAGALTLADRIRIVEQALVLVEQNYARQPLEGAMHAVNPVQRLHLTTGARVNGRRAGNPP